MKVWERIWVRESIWEWEYDENEVMHPRYWNSIWKIQDVHYSLFLEIKVTLCHNNKYNMRVNGIYSKWIVFIFRESGWVCTKIVEFKMVKSRWLLFGEVSVSLHQIWDPIFLTGRILSGSRWCLHEKHKKVEIQEIAVTQFWEMTVCIKAWHCIKLWEYYLISKNNIISRENKWILILCQIIRMWNCIK